MDEPDLTKAGPKGPPTTGPNHLHWDTSRQRSHDCTLATASLTPMAIILNFGSKRGHDYNGGELTVELLQRIVLEPLTAKHLAATLEKVIAGHDAGSRR
jgi:hypothetical protein